MNTIKLFSLFLVLTFTLVFTSCEDSSSETKIERAYYRTENAPDGRDGVYVTMSNGEQYKFGNMFYAPTEFTLGKVVDDSKDPVSVELIIDGTPELCNKYGEKYVDPIPSGTYKLNANGEISYLNNLTVEVRGTDYTFDGVAGKDLVYAVEYNHNGDIYLVYKYERDDKYLLTFAQLNGNNYGRAVLEPID